MPKKAEAPASPALLHVRPNPDLPPTDYVPGLPAAGAELPRKEAAALIASGLAVAAEQPADEE